MQGNRNPAQSDMIYKYLQEHGSITPMQAIDEIGCMRLGARIYELKHDRGVAIKTTEVEAINRYGKKVRYAKYVLDEQEACNV